MSPPAEPLHPLPRKDAFFGLHFDLHPQKHDTALGADITEENIARLLTRVRPDYVQYDCKGHRGYTGYPAQVGWPSPGIVNDSLAIWRKVTREHGVGLYIHYSGVLDQVAVEYHPTWAAVDAEGKIAESATSTFGPYADELLVPQLIEVARAYDLDGVWADGECWGAQLDWSEHALTAWRNQTGQDDAPRGPDDPRWLEWKTFHRRQFEAYLCHWVDALHDAVPGFQITSNWMYTTFAPKPVVAKLDWLSGDYSPTVSVDRARVEARYLANTGMAWDLMAWGFNSGQDLGKSLKPSIALEQEAGVVLMQGGGFQIYYQPTRAGYLADEIIGTAGQVADFCRARQAVSHKSTSVPQVALLLSSESRWDRSDRVYAYYGCEDELEGALHALLELHYSVDILAEHQLEPRLDEFPLVVIADAHLLTDEFRQAVTSYVENGGSLLLLGHPSARLFEPILGVRLDGEPEKAAAELRSAAGVANCDGPWQKVGLTTAEATHRRTPTLDRRKGQEPAATVAAHGKGKVAAVYGPVALACFRTHHPVLRAVVGELAEQLFPHPAVTVAAPPCVDAALRRTADGRLCLHLLNLANAQRADRFLATDFVPSVGPITVRLSVPHEPQKVSWVPDRDELDWTWREGQLSAAIPALHIHGALVVE